MKPQTTEISDMAIRGMILDLQKAMVLFAAVNLNVFGYLAVKPAAAEDVARACGSAPRSIEVLLNACVAVGLLTKENERYSNTELSATFLVSARPRYIGDLVKMQFEQSMLLSRLREAVITGQPVEPPQRRHGEDLERTRQYARAMDNLGRASGGPVVELIVSKVDTAGWKKLLDVGGGSGIFSVFFAQAVPALQAVVLDLSLPIQIARANILQFGLEDRIKTVVGDYKTVSFGAGYDAILFFSIFHNESVAVCEMLLKKAFDCLVSGGAVIIKEFLLNDAKTAPLFSALFSLVMMVQCEGRAYSGKEITGWLAQAGFVGVEVIPMPPPNPISLVIAKKP